MLANVSARIWCTALSAKSVEPRLYFYRDDGGVEIDLLDFTEDTRRLAVEVKSSMTYRDSYARHLTRVGDELGVASEERYVVARVEQGLRARGATVLPAAEWLSRLG